MPGMNLHGIFPPLTTPFGPDGAIAPARLRENIARYNRTGLAGYVVNGSTSESVLLRWEEVYRIWETAKEAAASGKALIAGTGAESTPETIEHTNRAASIGYHAALVRTPSFYKPAMNEEALAEHYLRVAEAARIPILVYSVPIFTEIKVEAPLIARVSRHPNIIGMKDSSGDIPGIAKIIAAGPRDFLTLVGSAATLYQSLEAGAVGAILALACAFPELCVEIYEASRAGDSARAQTLAKKLVPPAKMLGVQYGIAGLKYAMDRLGYFGGAPRSPLLPVNEAARHEIDAMLAGMVSESAARS
jgi:4-hydroxy-2-oxoglutarate aldolase